MTKDLHTELDQVLRHLADGLDHLQKEPVMSVFRYVLEYGSVWTPAPLPSEIPRMEAQNCFANCIALATVEDDLRYVEGYGISPEVGFPVYHAWLVDGDDRVIDPTWDRPERRSYRGVVVPLKFVLSLPYTGMALEALCASC